MTVLAIVQSWYVLGGTKCVFDRYIVIFIVTQKSRRTVNDPSWLSGIYLACSVSGRKYIYVTYPIQSHVNNIYLFNR